MGIEERKEREKKRRRNTIIDAAEKVLFSKGLDQATMEEIAEEAELSKGTLYLYFKNKNELYMALAERGSDILNSKFSKVFAEDRSGLELIRMMGKTYLDFVRNNPNYFNAFMYYETHQDIHELRESEMADTCEENLSEAMTFMVHALQIGIQDGTIDPSYDPKELAILIWASTRGITTIQHMKKKGHYFKMLDEMNIETSSLFESFLNLIGSGMATEEARKKEMTDSHNGETTEV